MGLRHVAFLLLLGACGELPLVGSDAGGDDAADDPTVDVSDDVVDGSAPDVDATVVDSSKKDAADATVTNDAAVDGDADVVEASIPDVCPKPADAMEPGDAYVALDAATAPWAVPYGGNQMYYAYGVAADSFGNVVLGAQINGFYLEAFDSTGKSTWKVNTGNAFVYATTFDPWGDVYVAALASGATNIGGGSIGPGAFVAKFDSKGNFVWQYGAFPSTTLRKLRTKSNGNVVAVGALSGTDDYGAGPIAQNGGSDVVLLELTPCSKLVTAKTWGGNGAQEAFALAIDANDEIFLGGRFESSIDFGGGTMTGPAAYSQNFNTFVAKLDSSEGYLHQINTNTNSNNTNVFGVATDSSGNVFVTGIDADSVDLGGGALVAYGYPDVFVGKLDSSLSHVWSNHYGAASSSMDAFDVATDPFGGAAITGYYSGNGLSMGQTNFPSGQGFFLTRFDSSGNISATFAALDAFPNAMSYVSWPDFAVVGRCGGTVALPSGTISCGGSYPAFVARLKP